MALTYTTELTPPVKFGSTDLGLHWGTTAPDGNSSPFSDLAPGSFYIQRDATTDESHWWQKVDNSAADDDWVKVFVDKAEEALSLEATLTMVTDNKVSFRDAAIFIHSNADGYLHLQADTAVTIGDGTNQLSIQSDGEITLEGTAKPTYTLPFPIEVGGGTADKEVFNGAASINLDADTETFLYGFRMPASWDAASDITLFFDVGNEIAEDDGDDVSFTCQVRGYADGETMSDAGQSVAALQDLTGGDQAINVINRVTGTIDYDDGTYPIAAGDTVIVKATVNLGAGSEATGPLHVVAWGIQYTGDSLG
jgi:hypothetical protein